MAKRTKKNRKRVSAKRRLQEHKTGGGSNYLKRLDDLAFFQPKAQRYRLDFMCFTAGEGNPHADPGDPYYERTFYVHQNIGPNREWHLCLAKTLKQTCPICEERARMATDPDADEAEVKALAPKERQLWLVRDLATNETLLWEISYYLFGAMLDKKLRNADEDDDYEYFADPEEGCTVRVSFEQSDKGKWLECSDIELRPRKTNYDLDIVEEMPCLDELLVPTPYDKLKKAFLQIEDEDSDDDDDDEDEQPKKRRKKSPKKSNTPTAEDIGLVEGMEVTYDGELCEIVFISKDGTSLTLEDATGDEYKAIGCDEVELVEEKPKKKKKTTKKKPTLEPEEDDDDVPFDDDDEEEEDEKPAPKKKTTTKKPTKKATKKKKPDPDPEDDDDDEWDDDWDDED